jgi:DNA-binding NarL/FixJ family response regulator
VATGASQEKKSRPERVSPLAEVSATGTGIVVPAILMCIQKASELKPDLILLAINFPNLNGIEVAKRIRQAVPDAKIVFLSIENDADMVQAALNSSGQGYILKTDAGSELWPAIEAVLQGKQYVSRGLARQTQTNRTIRFIGSRLASTPSAAR